MPTQLVKLALIDEAPLINSTAGSGGIPLETDLDIETFSIFQEGAQDASRQVVSIEANTSVLENNIEVVTSKVYTIDVVGLYAQSKRSKLHTWSSNRTPLYITGYGLDGSILYGYGAITVVEGFDNNTSFRFRFQNEAVGGYDTATSTHSAGFSYSPNGRAYWEWTANPNGNTSIPLWLNGTTVAGISEFGQNSPNGAGTAEAEDFTTTSTTVFSNGGWVVTPSGTSNWNWWHMYFPFDNVQLNMTWEVSEYAPPSSGDHYFAIRTYDTLYGYADHVLQDVEYIDGNGTFTSSLTTPVGTTLLRCYHRTGVDGKLIWSKPRLTIGKVKPFIEFNT